MPEPTEQQNAPAAAPQAGKKPKPEKSTYTTLRQVNHNNKAYPIGAPIQLTEEQAAGLLTHRAVKLATVEVPVDEAK